MGLRSWCAGLAAAAVVAALVAPGTATARTWPAWLHPCGVDQQCGAFSVPLDRAHPQAGTIGLNVVVIPALSANGRAPEALAAIAGGPGGASTTLAGWARSTFYTTSQHRDILLVDQRGTGKSKPLFCPDPVLVDIHGSTWGGSMIMKSFIGRGMRLEFRQPDGATITTSRILEIQERAPRRRAA